MSAPRDDRVRKLEKHRDTLIATAIEQAKSGALPCPPFVVDEFLVTDIAEAIYIARGCTGVESYHDVLLPLAERARELARPPTSKFHVGACALGASGRAYLGVNVEIPGVPLNHSVHAEQFALVNAMACGEGRIEAIATTEAPCGHCRQFMNELRDGQDLKVVTKDWRLPLRELLPHAFGPMDLIGDMPLLLEDQGVRLRRRGQEGENALKFLNGRGPLREDELDHGWRELLDFTDAALTRSYTPYTKSPAGIAVRTSCGAVTTGWALECAAYNPSMSPLQVVITRMVAMGKDLTTIERVVLREFCDSAVRYDETVRLAVQKMTDGRADFFVAHHNQP